MLKWKIFHCQLHPVTTAVRSCRQSQHNHLSRTEWEMAKLATLLPTVCVQSLFTQFPLACHIIRLTFSRISSLPRTLLLCDVMKFSCASFIWTNMSLQTLPSVEVISIIFVLSRSSNLKKTRKVPCTTLLFSNI